LTNEIKEKLPLVSIVLPTHNRADVLPFAIRSALYQTLKNFELWIVGDGCTDQTETVVKSFDDKRIKWLDLPKALGVGYSNRNVALQQSRGQYIAYLAHDDIWLRDHLELLVNKIKENNKDFVYSRSANISPDGIISISHFNFGNPNCLKDFLKSRACPRLSSIMHRKDCLDRYGYWSETIKFGGDVELWVRFFKAGKAKNFAFDPAPISSLIFRAMWHGRNQKWWLRPKEDIAYKLSLYKGVLPKQLQFDCASTKTEQETLWNIIIRDPIEWTYEFRKAESLWMDTRLHTMDYLSYFLFQKLVLMIKKPISAYKKRRAKKEKIALLKKIL
jgi:glycosyltransferase involved in cell wall biosynthesis